MLAQHTLPVFYANTADGSGILIRIVGVRACSKCRRFRLPEQMSTNCPDLCAKCHPEPDGSQPAPP